MIRFLNPFRKKVGYLGWTGRGNLGDEALYAIIKRLLRPVDLIKFVPFHGRGKVLESVQERLLSGMMMGAGTLINSRGTLRKMQHCLRESMPCFAFGAGVLDPGFYSSFPGYPDEMPLWVDCLRGFRAVSVRGPLSEGVLRDHGYREATVIGDPALSFTPAALPGARRTGVIGINFGTTRGGSCLWGGSDLKVREFAEKLARRLIEKGYRVRFFPVWREDRAVVEEAARSLDGKALVWKHSARMEDYLRAVDEVELFVGEKLHSVIGAVCRAKPSIMLAYQPKCLDFMESMGLSQHVLRTDALDLDRALAMLDSLLSEYEVWRRRIFERASGYKSLQQETAREIAAMVDES